jgi:hypothetical protein
MADASTSMPGGGYTLGGAIIGVGGDLLGGLINYFGIMPQQKAMFNQQMQFAQQQADTQNQQFGQTLAEGQRQFNAGQALAGRQLSQAGQLGNRQLDITEKGQEASIAESKAARAQALNQKSLSDKMGFLTNLTSFLNTPSSRAAYANIWRQGG